MATSNSTRQVTPQDLEQVQIILEDIALTADSLRELLNKAGDKVDPTGSGPLRLLHAATTLVEKVGWAADLGTNIIIKGKPIEDAKDWFLPAPFHNVQKNAKEA